MALNKAQLAKLQAAIAKEKANLAKAKAAAAPKPAAPTSGVIPGFKPTVAMPAPAKQPGQPGFVGPVATAPGTPAAATKAQVGPLGGLGAGVIAGVTGVPTGPAVPVEPVVQAVIPKEERTMAIDTFRKTLGLFFGVEEVTQGWVDALYKVTSGYYKTGSTIDESLNLALKDSRNNPELAPFTKRFKGLFEIQDRALAGEAIPVPTIAQFYRSQEELGEVMKRAGFPELSGREYTGDILGTGKSVSETTSLITDVFAAIDNSPAALKADLRSIAPGADRTAIAKALLMGKEGAAALTKQIAATTVFSAAKSQGLAINMTTAGDYAARGYGYDASLTGFGDVARGAAPLEKLLRISTGEGVTSESAQKILQQSIFEKNVAAQEQIRLESEKEEARFSGRSGTMGSRSLASTDRANRVI